MKIRIASALLALALPLVAQEPAATQVEATFYKAYYLEKGKRDFDGAMALYSSFLASAPEHKLAGEAAKQQFRLLDRTGKTKERDAFKAKYAKLLGDVTSTSTRPARDEEGADDRPERGARPEGGRPEGGARGQRGGGAGGRRGGIMGLMRNETKIADMSKEQLEELKTGLDTAPEMIDRMRQFIGEEAADKMIKGAADMKKALDAGKNEDAQKALDELKTAMPQRGGRGGRGGDAGGQRRGRGGEQGGAGGNQGGAGGAGRRPGGGNREGGGGGGGN